MTHRAQLTMAGLLVVAGHAAAGAWCWALLPVWRGSGPSVGAGAQYVFALLPSLGLAAAALVAGAGLAVRVRRVNRVLLPRVAHAVVAAGFVGAVAVLVWLARLGGRILMAAG